MHKALKSPERIQRMFDVVAKNYDLVNGLMTFGMDKGWRRIAAQSTNATESSTVLDACTGTGDLAITVNRITGASVIGVDFSGDMLIVAEEKIKDGALQEKISFVQASVMALPYEDNSFDAVTIGFGLRNTPDYKGALEEFLRVTKSGGRLVCLESSQPDNVLIRIPYQMYLKYALPLIGKVVSNNYQAYKYFADSTMAFPPKRELSQLMRDAGWDTVSYRSLFLGSVAVHVAIKEG